VTAPTPLASDAIDRRHRLFSLAICLEAAVSFAAPGFFLFLGTLYLPYVIARVLASGLAVWTLLWISMVVLGWCGLCAVVRVLFLLCSRRHHEQWSGWTLLGLACGIGVMLFFGYSGSTGSLRFDATRLAVAYLPVACTAHLIYLARRPLFTRRTVPF
jgi:hypothetical protein